MAFGAFEGIPPRQPIRHSGCWAELLISNIKLMRAGGVWMGSSGAVSFALGFRDSPWSFFWVFFTLSALPGQLFRVLALVPAISLCDVAEHG